jgi:heptose I phosphotransferase
VAVGAEFDVKGERFSFIATEVAPGVELEHLARTETDAHTRRRISYAVAKTLRRVHDARIGLPTVFGRHLFISGDLSSSDRIVVSLIDLDRIARPLVMTRRKARDLAQLHLSIPKTTATVRERLRFLRAYAGKLNRRELARIDRLRQYLERRKKNLAATYHGA